MGVPSHLCTGEGEKDIGMKVIPKFYSSVSERLHAANVCVTELGRS
jgi:hypothetical protein